nr:AraC family transcriptional regulator [uncultured Devosia sp.]
MTNALLADALRFAEIHADSTGIAQTQIPGLSVVRETMPTALQFAINRPLVALVLQGSKRVSQGAMTFDFSAGESLLISADVPTTSQITRANRAEPYVSVVLELDIAIITDLVSEMGTSPYAAATPVRVDPTDCEVNDAALRLLRLLHRPEAVPVLQAQLLRELHFWLVSGRHGGAIRALGVPDSHAGRVSQVVNLMRADFASTLRVEYLADMAGMSVSSFHAHFRAITSLSPLQFQKQLRLIEARRLMVSEGVPVASASFAVGYESVPQFTREYGRFFGQTPARDVRQTRLKA